MFARTSGGTRGSAPKADSGSVGARARIAYTTKLMTMIVGIAMRSRLRMYLPTYIVLIPAVPAARWSCPPRCRIPPRYAVWLLVPVLDAVHLGIPSGRHGALDRLADARGHLGPRHDRHDHDVEDQVVVRLLDERGPFRRVGLSAELVDDPVEGRVGVPVVVTGLPVVRLLGDL